MVAPALYIFFGYRNINPHRSFKGHRWLPMINGLSNSQGDNNIPFTISNGQMFKFLLSLIKSPNLIGIG